jgi:hypothetical protein
VTREPEKDEVTARVRDALRAVPDVRETDRAEASLTTLSFAGAADANRNVWIDTDLGGRLTIDLEDFTVEGEWDNAIARLRADDPDALVMAARVWLTGASAEEAIAVCPGRLHRR